MIVFIHGKQKRVPRPQLIDGLPVEEFIAQNADPVWLHMNEMWEYIKPDEDDSIELMMPDVNRPLVHLFTDGACIGNPGPGGWACILKHPASGKSKEVSGGEHNSTNNRMEIMAAIAGLEALKVPSEVELFSDSQYVVNAINEWIAKWKSFGWKRSKKGTAPIRNIDLWRRLDDQLQRHSVKANWVKGHVGHIENERCDTLAVAAAARIASTPPAPIAARDCVADPLGSESLFGDSQSE